MWEKFGMVEIDEWANPNQMDGKILADELCL